MANYTSSHTGAVIDAAVTKIAATTSSATELNILDGVTATTAEINILDGVTSTAAELNILDGVTSTTAELNILDGVTATASEINILDGVTSTTAELNILDGVTSTAAELNVLDGYTGSVTELNYLDTLHATGVTSTEFDYLDGVTSNIQTQLNSKIEATLTSEQVQDVVGAMFSSNTETGITATYQDGDGTIDLVVGTLNQDTTGNAATATALETARTIHGVSFDGSANIDLTEVVQDTVGAMFSSNTETNITATYQDSDGTIDLVATGDVSLVTSSHDYLSLSGQAITLGQIDISDDTNLSAGTNISLSGDTLNVDDAFLINSGNDTTSGTITAAGFTTTGTLAAGLADIDDVVINGTTIGHTDDTDLITLADGNVTIAGELDLTTLDVSGDADIDGTLEADAITVNGTALNTVIAGVTVANATLAATATVSDSTANTNFPVVFHNESNGLLDDTGALRYNPSTGELLVPKLTVAGTTTTADTVTMEAANAVIFEGATADSYETTLSIVDPTADHTQYLINQGGYIPVLAAATTTAISSTPAELNILDGATVVVGEINYLDLGSTAIGTAIASKAVVLDANKDYTGVRNLTITGELDGGSLDISGDADIDGTLETDALSINGTAVSSTAAELNVLDGITSTTAELNILDGVTATAAELNIMDGVTATTAELNYTDGVTSNIQTQLDATLDTAGTGIDISSTTISVDVSDFMANGSNNYVLTATGTDAFRGEGNLTFDGSTLAVTGALTTTSSITPGSIVLGGHSFNDIDIGSEFVDADDHLMTSGAIKEKIESYGYTTTGAITALNNATANELVTVGSTTTELDAEANLTFDGTDLAIAAGGKISVDEVEGKSNNTNTLLLNDDQTAAVNMVTLQSINHINIMTDGNNNGTGDFKVFNGSYDVDTADLAFRITSTGLARFENDIDIPATNKIYLDGRGNTYITESSGDTMKLVAGGQDMLILAEASDDMVYVPDSVYLAAGTGQDFTILHDGSNTTIANATGDLTIQNHTTDGDIHFKVDDGGGNDITALQIDASENGKAIFSDSVKIPVGKSVFFGGSEHTYIREDIDDRLRFFCGGDEFLRFTQQDAAGELFSIYQNVYMGDDVKIQLGSSQDLKLHHDATNSYIQNSTGNLYIQSNEADKDLVLQCDDGSGGTTAYLTLDGSATNVITHQNLCFEDTNAIIYRNSGQMELITYGGYNIDLNPAGDVRIDGASLMIPATEKLYLDGGTHTYIYESSDDNLSIFVGGQEMIKFYEGGTDYVHVNDNTRLGVGNSPDFYIYHDATNTHQINTTGDLYIKNSASDEDIYLQVSDGGSTVTAIYINADSEGDVYFPNDYQRLIMGAGNDLQFIHNGTNSYMENYTGDLYIDNYADDGDIIFRNDDGSGGIATYIQIDGGATITKFDKATRHDDSVTAYFGGGLDLRIYHNGSNSYIANTTTGDLYIQNELDDKDIILRSDDGSGGVTPYLTLDGSAGYTTAQKKINFEDGVYCGFGNSTDAAVYHDGSNSYYQNWTGDMYIVNNTTDGDIYFKVDDGGGGDITAIKINADSEGDVHLPNDNQFLYIGAGNDSYFGHDATNSIWGNNTGTLQIRNHTSDADMFLSINDGGSHIHAIQIDASDAGSVILPNDSQYLKLGAGGDLQLYHDGTDDIINTKGTAFKLLDNGTERLRINSSGNIVINENGNSMDFRVEGDTDAHLLFVDGSADAVGIGTSSPATTMEIDGILTMEDVSIPAEGVAGHAQMFSNSGEMKVNDASGNITTISPHNFELIPEGASEEMAWSHHSQKGDKTVNVDMMKLARLVEQLTGEKLVYIDEE